MTDEKDDLAIWASDCIAALSIVADPDYPFKPDSKQLAHRIASDAEEINRLKTRVFCLETNHTSITEQYLLFAQMLERALNQWEATCDYMLERESQIAEESKQQIHKMRDQMEVFYKVNHNKIG